MKKAVVKRELKHEQYKNCLLYRKQKHNKMNMIGSNNHKMFSIKLNKVSLSPDFLPQEPFRLAYVLAKVLAYVLAQVLAPSS